MDVIFTEEVIIEIHQLNLSHCREELTLLNRIKVMVNLKFTTATSYRTRTNQYHLISMPAKPCNLVNKRRHTSDVELARVCGEDIRTYFYYNSFHITKAIESLKQGECLL